MALFLAGCGGFYLGNAGEGVWVTRPVVASPGMQVWETLEVVVWLEGREEADASRIRGREGRFGQDRYR